MANRLEHLFLNDFTGGVNLRADAFQLASNELDGVCNMEIDPRGGAWLRPGWRRYNDDDITDDTWNPRAAHLFTRSSAASILMVANGGKVWASTDGSFSDLEVSAEAEGHLASFTQWGDTLYMALGKTEAPRKWTGTGETVALTPVGGAVWQDDYTDPVDGCGVQAEHVVSHFGYIFAANTREDGTNHPNRLRWSHPNSPENYAQADYIDFDEIPAITAIRPYGDHLLVFGANSVWALYGYDQVSWQVTSVTRNAGVAGPNAVSASETHIFFFSFPDGVFAYSGDSGGNKLEEISLPLRPIFLDGRFNGGNQEEVFLGWMNRRLWFNAPYSEVGGESTAFVYEPSLNAWTAHVGADGRGLGPFVQDTFSDSPRFFGCSRSTPAVMQVDRGSAYTDDHDGTDTPYDSWFVTRWVDGGTPDGKKSWKRPTFVAKEYPSEYNLGYEVYHDYDESKIKRAKAVQVETGGDNEQWGDFVWGDGTKWGRPVQGAHIERGSSLGTAMAVQLLVKSNPGVGWGVDGINFKYIRRRYR